MNLLNFVNKMNLLMPIMEFHTNGFAVIKLDRIVDTRLHESGIDAFDGTPVLDIKPWLPSIDCPSDNGALEIECEIGLGNKYLK